MSATTTPTDSPVIHPMHNPAQAAVVQQPLAPVGNTRHLLVPGQGTKAMLAKKMIGKGSNPKYISPTDKMMTPCTAKINQSKKKNFNKAKPVQFFMATNPALEPHEEPSEDSTSASDDEGVNRPKSENQDSMIVDDENPF